MDTGLQLAIGQPITNPLPVSWISRADAPLSPPSWASIGALTSKQIQNLLSQIAYDLSAWDYAKIGTNNELGRYQFSTQELETYGLLEFGSNQAYSTDSVNYVHCWTPTTVNNGINNYQNYFYNISSLYSFLSTAVAQEHLAYQKIVDLYKSLVANGGITVGDTVDVVAGMVYVAWTLGADSAYLWRTTGAGAGVNSYNSGRYAVTVL